MLVKLSSSRNDSDPLQNHLTPTSSMFLNMYCVFSPNSGDRHAGFFLTNSLVLLLQCFLVFYHGAFEWKQKRSTSSLLSTMSHADFFTYHHVLMDLIGAFGCIVCCCGIYTNKNHVYLGGAFPWFYSWFGETLFHIVTCLERYLAIVHPVTYMRLRNDQGLRVRNISTGCVWFLSFLGTGLMFADVFVIGNFCVLAIVIAVVGFCCLSALLALTRPSPGKQPKLRADRPKRRAFYTLVAILGVLLLRFVAGLAWTLAYVLQLSYGCVIMESVVWFTLPSSLVLPLLFFHRAKKLLCCKISF